MKLRNSLLPLCLAAGDLERARRALATLPNTREVEELRSRSGVFMSVLYGIIVSRVPTLRDDQRMRLLAAVGMFLCDVDAIRQRLLHA